MISYEYLWEDGSRYKRPTKLPAPDYVDALMNWAQALLDDEAVFPNRIGKYTKLSSPPLIVNLLNLPAPNPCYLILCLCKGVPFPKNFRETVRTITRRLFRVYAHLYSNHFDQICALGIEGLSTLT